MGDRARLGLVKGLVGALGLIRLRVGVVNSRGKRQG